MVEYPIPDLERLLRRQQEAWRADPPDYIGRRRALSDLQELLLGHQEDIVGALNHDFGNRSRHETLLAEVFLVVEEARHARRHLRRWMAQRRVGVGWQFLPGRARIIRQPLGVVGIIGAWNYPLQLTLEPLVGALAAGNHALLKPSELAPHTAALLERLLAWAYPPEYVAVVNGDAQVGAAFAALPFDHLLFTGSSRVARQVMQVASHHLTPVTLELGGKSPAIVGDDYPLALAARRIMAGKLFNAGQSCVAPDYVLVHVAHLEAFVEQATIAARRLYPQLKGNPDYTRIINAQHYERLVGYQQDAAAKGARLVSIIPADEVLGPEDRIIPPTLVLNANESMQVMQEEIFGPLLPILPYRSLDEAIAFVGARPRPLSLYYFGENRRRIQRVLEETFAGGVTINDTLYHYAQTSLPFGGVGDSGMGYYHGRFGFETFSKAKGIYHQPRHTPLALFQPPFGRMAERLIRLLLGA